jgi:hypothetical protein
MDQQVILTDTDNKSIRGNDVYTLTVFNKIGLIDVEI